MSTATVFCLVTCLVAAAAADEAHYTTKWDNVDLGQILNNDRLFNSYYNCLIDKGNCTPDGAELKKAIPDALTNGCSKCSEKQKEGTKAVMKHLMDKAPEKYGVLEKKFDPEGIYRKMYSKEKAKYGV